jgi:hypothetical protein
VAAKPPSGQKGFKTFNEKDFVLEVPRGFTEQQSPAASDFGAGGRPKSTYGAPAHACLSMRAVGGVRPFGKVSMRPINQDSHQQITEHRRACDAERAAAITPLRVKFTSEDGQVHNANGW